MKKFFKGILNLIKRHKILTFICFMAFVGVIGLGFIFFDMFTSGKGKYGDRLIGIDDVKISSEVKKEIEDNLEAMDEVVDASVRVQGKIIYINLEFSRETSLDRAKEIANETLNKFSDDEKSFYDFGYFLTQVPVEDTEDKGFVVTGSKNSKLDTISWIKSQVNYDE